jgi:hypothetical protein
MRTPESHGHWKEYDADVAWTRAVLGLQAGDIGAIGRATDTFPRGHDSFGNRIGRGVSYGEHGDHFARGRREDMTLKTLPAATGSEPLHACLRRHDKQPRHGIDPSARMTSGPPAFACPAGAGVIFWT